METSCTYIPYKSTGYFSKIVNDYIDGDEKLKPFYHQPPTIDGIKAAIEGRSIYSTDRELLVSEIREQHKGLVFSEKQEQNLHKLLLKNTFTICTAHQPNLFTGHLYFIYKILHAVKLADQLNEELKDYNFVPVFYMGSEDADFDELGHIVINGEKLEWQTKQTGAFGRMVVDKDLVALIDRMAGQLGILEHGEELISLLKKSYQISDTIQFSTLKLVNDLFNEFGLLIVMPDNEKLKRPFNSIIQKELLEQFSSTIVEDTTAALNEHYKIQAGGREINLFYLIDDKRERIEKSGELYVVRKLNLSWKEKEILEELNNHPDRFSSNVILRGVFQEMILPNVAFIGGGGEIAYWLELKKVFEACNVPFPVLVVRNSFLISTSKHRQTAQKLGFEIPQLFNDEEALLNDIVKRNSGRQLQLEKEKSDLAAFYNHLDNVAASIEVTLKQHIASLGKKALKTLIELEKKMLRAEKRKFEAQARQLNKLRDQLFPNNSLQERTDNFAPYFAAYGSQWLNAVYEASQSLKQEFCLMEINKEDQ